MTIDYNAPLGHNVERSKPKPKRSSKKQSLSIDQQIANLQALGFTVTVPTSSEEVARQGASLEKLGFAEAQSKKSTKAKRTVATPEYLTGHLYLAHSIAEGTYGPGAVKLPLTQQSLFRSLMQQDQAAVRSLMDTSDRQPFSRCYLITPGRGQDQKNKFTKLEVSQETFDSDHFINNVTVRAGATDIAGYNPTGMPSTF